MSRRALSVAAQTHLECQSVASGDKVALADDGENGRVPTSSSNRDGSRQSNGEESEELKHIESDYNLSQMAYRAPA